MSVEYEDIMTKCPYYLRTSKYSVTCEGVIDGTKTVTKFDEIKQRQMFQKRECFRYPNDCPIAKEIDRRV